MSQLGDWKFHVYETEKRSFEATIRGLREEVARLTAALATAELTGWNMAKEAAAKEAEAQRRIYMANVQGHMSIELADNYRFGIEACRVVESAIRTLTPTKEG